MTNETKKSMKIKSIKLKNFKGTRDAHIIIEREGTNIYGANGVGKTTIYDAFMWLMFGKDSKGRSDFNVKTLDVEKNVIPHLEHSVEIEAEINGQDVSIEKRMLDKWETRRGTTEKEFKGNTTEYAINNVPKKQKEFQEFIGSFVDENVFKMVTNPLHFNEMPWKERRNIVLKMVEQPTEEEILEKAPNIEEIIEMARTKTTDEIKAELDASKQKLSKQLTDIPARIDEAKMSLFDSPAIDEEMIEEKKRRKDELEKRLEDSVSIFEEVSIKKEKLYLLKQESQNKKMLFEKEQNEKKKEFLAEQEKEPTRIQQKIAGLEKEVSHKQLLVGGVSPLIEAMESKRKSLHLLELKRTETEEKVFKLNKSETMCPTCQRELDNVAEKIKQMEDSFNDNKKQMLLSLEGEISTLKEEEGKIGNEIDATRELNLQLETEIASLKKEGEDLLSQLLKLEKSKEQYKELEYQEEEAAELKIKALSSELKDVNTWGEAQNIIRKDIEKLTIEIDREYVRVETELRNNKETNERIEEIKKSEREKNNAVARVERLQDMLSMYIVTRVDLMEKEVNDKFRLANFKMFDVQINGGIKETCDVTVKGVPFMDLNTAMKINVGLDVIEALNNHFKVVAPIFIDNRESVTKIIKTEAQVINLLVSMSDKVLRVEGVGTND